MIQAEAVGAIMEINEEWDRKEDQNRGKKD